MEHRDLNFRIKGGVTDSGTFVGLGAAYGNTDLGGDSIVPGAFNRTLQGSKTFPLLWQHDPGQPIGTVKCSDSPQGLQVEGQLLLSDPTGAKAYNLLKNGVLKGLSIGYDTMQESFQDGVRLLKELRLWEVSIVTFPMNLSAGVTSVKNMTDAERKKHLTGINEHRKQIDRSQRAIRMHLKSLFGDDMFGDDGDDDTGDPDLLESGEDMEAMGLLLFELKALAAETEVLARQS
jgi:HK97 family phage prohead protease